MEAQDAMKIVLMADEPDEEICCLVKNGAGYVRYEIDKAAELKEKGTGRKAIGLFLVEASEMKEKENNNEPNFCA